MTISFDLPHVANVSHIFLAPPQYHHIEGVASKVGTASCASMDLTLATNGLSTTCSDATNSYLIG